MRLIASLFRLEMSRSSADAFAMVCVRVCVGVYIYGWVSVWLNEVVLRSYEAVSSMKALLPPCYLTQKRHVGNKFMLEASYGTGR